MPRGKPGIKEPPKEVFRIPWDATKVLTEITSQVRLKTGAKVTKTSIIAELLYLLKSARVDPKSVHSVDDVIDQLKEYIRKAVK